MSLDLEQFVMAGFVLIGLVNGVNLAFEKKWESFVKFVIAVAAGVFFGFMRWFGIPSVEVGLAIGLNSSGIYKIIQLATVYR